MPTKPPAASVTHLTFSIPGSNPTVSSINCTRLDSVVFPRDKPVIG